jgi:hypothetical protein
MHRAMVDSTDTRQSGSPRASACSQGDLCEGVDGQPHVRINCEVRILRKVLAVSAALAGLPQMMSTRPS